MALPATSLRSNLATWAVPTTLLPAVARCMTEQPGLGLEKYDPDFQGQQIETYYFDTRGFALRKARWKGKRYMTIRLREYGRGAWAFSVKTESDKYREELTPEQGKAIESAADPTPLVVPLLNADSLARLMELTEGDDLHIVSCVRCRRFAVEEAQGKGHRLTLDVGVVTDTGVNLAENVLEFKSTDTEAAIPQDLDSMRLRPMKLSKFLWSTHHSGYHRVG
jgi:hypothetical protein